jgi:uncharacterized membrane protein YoaK (UPF0700 family)
MSTINRRLFEAQQERVREAGAYVAGFWLGATVGVVAGLMCAALAWWIVAGFGLGQ